MRTYIERILDIFNRKGPEHKESVESGIDEETEKDKEIEPNILIGSMSFDTFENCDYSMNRFRFLILQQFPNTDYSLCVNMTENNELEFIHTYVTTTRLKADVSSLCSWHEFSFSWDVKNNHFAIYIDRNLVMENRAK